MPREPSDLVSSGLREALLEKGYARIPGAISEVELRGIRAALTQLIDERPRPFYRTPIDFEHGAADAVGRAVNGDCLYRVKYSLDKDPGFLKLLGHPVLLQAVATVIAKPFVVCWDDLMVKEAHEPFTIPWHQDSESGGETAHVYSVYLTGSGDNPLRLIPGTHRLGARSAEEIESLVASRQDEIVTVGADAGDILIHNNNVLHMSGPCGDQTRLTVAFDFRDLESVRRNPLFGTSFLDARKYFVGAAVRARLDDPDLSADDRVRRLQMPASGLWDHGTPPGEWSAMSFRVSQHPTRWRLHETEEAKLELAGHCERGLSLERAAEQVGISEEAAFKWLCELGKVMPDDHGRYLDTGEL